MSLRRMRFPRSNQTWIQRVPVVEVEMELDWFLKRLFAFSDLSLMGGCHVNVQVLLSESCNAINFKIM